MSNEKLLNDIKCELEGLYVDEILNIVSRINGEDGRLEDFQYYLNDTHTIRELFDGREILETMKRAYFGKWKPSDDYFRFDIYENLESVTLYELRKIFKNNQEEIAEAILEVYEDRNEELLENIDYNSYELEATTNA